MEPSLGMCLEAGGTGMSIASGAERRSNPGSPCLPPLRERSENTMDPTNRLRIAISGSYGGVNLGD